MQPQTIITKRGMKLIRGEYSWEPDHKIALATFICPSLREILKIFGKNILILHASTEKQIDINKDKHFGFNFCRIKSNICSVNYEKSKYGELTKQDIKKINKLLDKYNLIDCAVDYLKIELKDEELRKIINEIYEKQFNFPVLSNIFHAELKLVKCEGEADREKWEETPYNKDILAPNKFKRSLLHCIRLVDDGQAYNIRRKSRRVYYINWEPSRKSVKIEELKSPIEIVSALKQNFMPYGYTKEYVINQQNKLVLSRMF